MQEAIDLLNALTPLAWPIVILIVALKLAPAFASVLKGRDVQVEAPGVKVAVGGRQVELQEFTDQARKTIEDLQARISEASAFPDPADDMPTVPPLLARASTAMRAVLWVDDEPDGIALEVASLQDRGIDVSVSTSTADAVARLERGARPDAVITDMGRFENGRRNARAGLELLDEIRRRDAVLPVVVYTTPGNASALRSEVLSAGAFGITSSPSELLELLGVNIGPRTE